MGTVMGKIEMNFTNNYYIYSIYSLLNEKHISTIYSYYLHLVSPKIYSCATFGNNVGFVYRHRSDQ